MSCNCQTSNDIVNCVTTIEAAYIEAANTDIYVYLKNVTTGRVERYTATSDADGYFSFDPEGLNDKHLYEVTVTLASTTNPQDTLLLTIDGNETCCIQFTARGQYYAGDVDSELTQRLTVENCATTNTPSDSTVRYKQTATDYVHTSNIWIVGVTDTSAARTITLCNPADFPTGQPLTIKDESGGAATNNITVSGTIEGGAFVLIQSDYGAITLYSDGVSTWYVESDI